jgi:hypothetical protein
VYVHDTCHVSKFFCQQRLTSPPPSPLDRNMGNLRRNFFCVCWAIFINVMQIFYLPPIIFSSRMPIVARVHIYAAIAAGIASLMKLLTPFQTEFNN